MEGSTGLAQGLMVGVVIEQINMVLEKEIIIILNLSFFLDKGGNNICYHQPKEWYENLMRLYICTNYIVINSCK
jgi:hypothetical protein